MAIPGFLLLFLFHTFPVIRGAFYSFTNWKGYGSYDFVGLKNYIELFNDSRVMDSYIFTFKFAVISTILVNIFSLVLAVGLNAKIKFKNTLRAVYFTPHILSILIVGFIFKHIFTYVLPEIGQTLGIEILAKNILGYPDLAWIGIVVLAVWQSSGFHIILYLAGLQTIPQNLYEAADIDGANNWQKFWRVTFPLLAPFFTVNLVVAMRNFMMVFDHIVALTNGGPGRATESISLIIYRGGFEGGEFGYQTANSVIYFIFILVIAVIQVKFLQRREVQL